MIPNNHGSIPPASHQSASVCFPQRPSFGTKLNVVDAVLFEVIWLSIIIYIFELRYLWMSRYDHVQGFPARFTPSDLIEIRAQIDTPNLLRQTVICEQLIFQLDMCLVVLQLM